MFCQSAPPASSPAPRLTARSMLSLGTEDFLAFWMASNRVGLPFGSAPPVRAATSMFLMSLANSLPRLASLAAFWCLVVAHLGWPLMPCASLRFGARLGVDDSLADARSWSVSPLVRLSLVRSGRFVVLGQH